MSSVLNALGDLAPLISYTNFTKVQEQVIPLLMSGEENAVIAAPTGSGKTLLLEVAMLRLFRARLLPSNTSKSTPTEGLEDAGFSPLPTSSSGKAVYICPIKALASEKYAHWKHKFAPLSVIIETGDQDRQRSSEENLAEVSGADLILTTPERWDSITRRWREKEVMSIVHCVKLLLLDEIHTVHEDRGAALEALVSRMKTIKAATEEQARGRDQVCGTSSPVRFVATSATLPNVEDFAEWLEVPPHMVFSFTNQDRPVPLYVKVIGYTSDTKNPFAFDRFLSYKLFALLREYGDSRPAMIFCASRKEAVSSAQRIVQDLRVFASREGRAESLRPSAEIQKICGQANDKQLRECLVLGIAYHHAALAFEDRQLVEDMFKKQLICVLCTTTTLALGVNLPAHLVVIKGTTFFKGGRREDVPLSEVAQMCGRAGRPGMDNCGVALILTTEDKVGAYESLRHGDAYTTVESQLHRHMIEHVNAEIVLRTIHSFASGLQWVRTTFFWIRLKKCPQYYGLQFATKEEQNAFAPEQFVQSLIERVIHALHEEGCIELDQGHTAPGPGVVSISTALDAVEECAKKDLSALESTTTLQSFLPPCVAVLGKLRPNARVASTRLGRSMARLYILFATVQNFNQEMRSRQGASRNPPQRFFSSDGGGDTLTPHNSSTAKQNSDGTLGRALERVGSTGTLKPRFSLADVLMLLSRCDEFREIRLRQGDRGPLNDLNKCVKFSLSSGKRGGREVREDWHKVYVLIQAQIAQISSTDASLRNDCVRLWALVPRLMRFTCEYAWYTGSFSFATQANLLHRCIEQRVWPDGLVLRQLDAVNEAAANALARSGYQSFSSIAEADCRKLEMICGRLPPYGSQLKAAVTDIPTCEVTIRREQTFRQGSGDPGRVHPLNRSRNFTITVNPQTSGPAPAHPPSVQSLLRWKKNGIKGFLLVVGSVAADCIIIQRSLPAALLTNLALSRGQHTTLKARYDYPAPVTFQFSVPVELLVAPFCFLQVVLIMEPLVGGDVVFTIDAAAAAEGEDIRSSRLLRKASPVPGSPQTSMDAFLKRPKSSTVAKEDALIQAEEGDGPQVQIADGTNTSFETFLRDLEYIHGDSATAHPRRQRSSLKKATARPNKGRSTARVRRPRGSGALAYAVASPPESGLEATEANPMAYSGVPPSIPHADIVSEQDAGAIELIRSPEAGFDKSLEGVAQGWEENPPSETPQQSLLVARSPSRDGAGGAATPPQKPAGEVETVASGEEDDCNLPFRRIRQVCLPRWKSPEPYPRSTLAVPTSETKRGAWLFGSDVKPTWQRGGAGGGAPRASTPIATPTDLTPPLVPFSFARREGEMRSIGPRNFPAETVHEKRQRSSRIAQDTAPQRRFSFGLQYSARPPNYMRAGLPASPPGLRSSDQYKDSLEPSAGCGGPGLEPVPWPRSEVVPDSFMLPTEYRQAGDAGCVERSGQGAGSGAAAEPDFWANEHGIGTPAMRLRPWSRGAAMPRSHYTPPPGVTTKRSPFTWPPPPNSRGSHAPFPDHRLENRHGYPGCKEDSERLSYYAAGNPYLAAGGHGDVCSVSCVPRPASLHSPYVLAPREGTSACVQGVPFSNPVNTRVGTTSVASCEGWQVRPRADHAGRQMRFGQAWYPYRVSGIDQNWW